MNNETEKSAFDISKNGGDGAVPLRRAMPISTSLAIFTTCRTTKKQKDNQVLLHSSIGAEECRQADINNEHEVISYSFSLVIPSYPETGPPPLSEPHYALSLPYSRNKTTISALIHS
jgi:hypothetical protein